MKVHLYLGIWAFRNGLFEKNNYRHALRQRLREIASRVQQELDDDHRAEPDNAGDHGNNNEESGSDDDKEEDDNDRRDNDGDHDPNNEESGSDDDDDDHRAESNDHNAGDHDPNNEELGSDDDEDDHGDYGEPPARTKKRTNKKTKPNRWKKRIRPSREVDDWGRFYENISCNDKAREIVRPFADKAVEIAERYEELLNPLSPMREHLKTERITNGACVYVIIDKRTGKVVKVGCTCHYRDRLFKYEDDIKFAGDNYEFVKVFDFENVSSEYYQEAEENYNAMMEALIDESNELSPFQRRFFKALYQSKGEELGPKKKLMLFTVEYGVQRKYDVPAPVEFLMFDKEAMDTMYKLIESDSKLLLDVLDFLFDGEGDIYVGGTASWDTASDQLSSKIMTLEAILGKIYKDNWRDTIPHAACPDAETREEVFSEDYDPEDKASGRKRLHEDLNDLVENHSKGLLYVDTNRILFEDDATTSYEDVHEFLEERNFELLYNLRDEVYAYRHGETRHAVLVHRPLCVASSSIEGLPHEHRCKRSVTAGILCNVRRTIDGKPPLSENEKFANHVEAFYYFHIQKTGFQQGLRQASANYRYAVRLDNRVNPLTENELAKCSTALPNSLKKNSTESDFKAIPRARRVFCKSNYKRTSTKKGRKALFNEVMDVLSTDINGAKKKRFALKKCLDRFLTHFRITSDIPRVFESLWKDYRSRPGNPGAQYPSTETIETNNDTLKRFVEKHKPKSGQPKGEPFWIEVSDNEEDRNRTEWAKKSVNRWCMSEFPGTYETLPNMRHDSLRERFTDRETKSPVATRYPELGLHVQNRISISTDKTIYILVAMAPKRGRAVVESSESTKDIESTEDSESTEDNSDDGSEIGSDVGSSAGSSDGSSDKSDGSSDKSGSTIRRSSRRKRQVHNAEDNSDGEQQVYRDGTPVYKDFDNGTGQVEEFSGEITGYDRDSQLYHIKYDDGDSEDMDADEVQKHLHSKKNQEASEQGSETSSSEPKPCERRSSRRKKRVRYTANDSDDGSEIDSVGSNSSDDESDSEYKQPGRSTTATRRKNSTAKRKKSPVVVSKGGAPKRQKKTDPKLERCLAALQDPKLERYVVAIHNFKKNSREGKFPKKSQMFDEVNWATVIKSQHKSKKLPDEDPRVVALKAIGFIQHEPAKHITKGNKVFNKQDREAWWLHQLDEVKKFVKDPKLGGFDALLNKRNPDLTTDQYKLAKWIETQKTEFSRKNLSKTRQDKLASIKGSTWPWKTSTSSSTDNSAETSIPVPDDTPSAAGLNANVCNPEHDEHTPSAAGLNANVYDPVPEHAPSAAGLNANARVYHEASLGYELTRSNVENRHLLGPIVAPPLEYFESTDPTNSDPNVDIMEV